MKKIITAPFTPGQIQLNHITCNIKFSFFIGVGTTKMNLPSEDKDIIIQNLSLRLILLMKIFCVVNHADHVDRRHYFEKQNLIIQSNVLAIILGIISTIQPELDASCDTFHAEVAGNTKGTRNFNKGFLRSPYKGKASSSRKFLLEAKKIT